MLVVPLMKHFFISAIRKELSRRNQMTSDTMKAQMSDVAAELEKHKQDQQDISAGNYVIQAHYYYY